ncbi:MAG: 30S ribosomal protein S8 [Chloroflexi bacterium]|nr:30S ribosomal protein S8 [Chloroflexota bacterium]
MSDPIADMLTRIRNGAMVRHSSVLVPASKSKIAIAKILKDEGFIKDYEILKDSSHRVIRVHLSYVNKKQSVVNGLLRVSKPGLRIYVQKGEIPRVYGGLGIAILSTPLGVLAGREAWKRGVGGEVLCYVW